MFLLGKGIPSHITNMPQAVLYVISTRYYQLSGGPGANWHRDSPFGQMLMPAINQQVRANKRGGGILGIRQETPGSLVKTKVRVVSTLAQLDELLEKSRDSCAVVFFTSATCSPCKALYPLYEELAAEVEDKGVLIKVDITQAFGVAARYSVSATPTFITFLKGQPEKRWSGADPVALRANIRLLIEMAWPPHPHQALNVPTFSNPDAKPVIFSKIPPLPKLLAKMGPAASDPAIQHIKQFLETRSSSGPAEAPLPDVAPFTSAVRDSLDRLPTDLLFTVIDLLRCSLVDPRFSGCLAEEPDHQTVVAVLEHVNNLAAAEPAGGGCPYALRLVTLQMACNLFSSPLYPDQILAHDRLRGSVTRLISSSFLDEGHASVRVAAASLLFNVALANSRRRRREGPGAEDALPEGEQVELAASALEAITREEGSAEALEGMLLALGYLAYRLPLEGELAELLRAMDAGDLVLGKEKGFPGVALVREVGGELLGKGLKTG